MNQDGSTALFQYWNGLRGSRPAPRRSEIEPADIKAQLPDTFILERDARGEPVFRLAGTRLCATYGKELKSHAFLSLWAAGDQPVVGRLLRNVLDEDAVAVIAFEGVSEEERVNRFELIVLPLASEHGGTRALGAVHPRMKPFWLGADPIVENRVEGFRLVDPDRETPAPGARPSLPVPTLWPDGEDLTDPFETRRGRRIRHLVVFDGGRHE